MSRVQATAAAVGAGANSKQTILVIDDAAFCREMTAAALQSKGFRVLTAGDGLDGLSVLEQSPVDLIILDEEMPQMDGLEFLKAMRAETKWKRLPVIMLTGNANKETVTQALRFNVLGYMLKANFSLPTLLQRVMAALGPADRTAKAQPAPAAAAPVSAAPAAPAVKLAADEAATVPGKPAAGPEAGKPTAGDAAAPAPAAATAASTPTGNAPGAPSAAPAASAPAETHRHSSTSGPKVPSLVPRDVALTAIADLQSAKTLSGVAAEILTLTDSPTTNLPDVTAVLRQDPALAARVLQLANSAAYSRQKAKLTNLDDAVRNIGASGVRDIVLSASVFDAFPTGKANGMDLLRCWQHSFGVAAILSRVMPRIDGVASGVPYIVGLCHDLAELMLRQKFPAEFSAAVDFLSQMPKSMTEILSDVFSTPYSELGSELFSRLKIPNNICEPLREYGALGQNVPKPGTSQIVRALIIADQYAHGILLASSTAMEVAPIHQADCRTALISNTALNGPEIRSETITQVSMLAKLSAEQETDLFKPLLPQKQSNVWYMRHQLFAQIDPLEAALAHLTKPRTEDRMPRPEEKADVQGIVAALPNQESATAVFGEAVRYRDATGNAVPILILSPAAAALPKLPGVESLPLSISLARLGKFTSALRNA